MFHVAKVAHKKDRETVPTLQSTTLDGISQERIGDFFTMPWLQAGILETGGGTPPHPSYLITGTSTKKAPNKQPLSPSPRPIRKS